MALKQTCSNLGPEVSAYLRGCSTYYDQLLEQLNELCGRGRPEATLTWLEMTAGFAATNHTGRFADGALENVALNLGRVLPSAKERPPRALTLGAQSCQNSGRRRVVHVATVAMTISGHTRTIINWIRKDQESRHSIILTRQGVTPVPAELIHVVAESGGEIFAFPDTAWILDRANWLRQLASERGDMAILHLIPNDVVPILAFAEKTRIPVALVNLADQCFWIGSTVSDSTINLRDVSSAINDTFRFTRNALLVPIPIFDPQPLVPKNIARAQLGISKSERMLLTVGRAIKYTPSRRQSFFRTANKILESDPEAHLYIVGVAPTDHRLSNTPASHRRMHFLGPLPDPSPYQLAADVYLEGFPFGSQTALLESVLPGTPCVRAIAPLHPVLAASDVSINGISPVPDDESEYLALARRYLSDRETRAKVGKRLRRSVTHYHVGDQWYSLVGDAYDKLGVLQHEPIQIPTTYSSTHSVHLAISEYHGTRFLVTQLPQALDAYVRELIFGSAFALRQRGAYREALQLIRKSNYGRHWWDRRSLSFTAKLLPHKLVSTRRPS